MKQILCSLLICVLFAVGQTCYAQATAGQHDPYRNLTKYYIYNNDWNYDGVLPPQYVWHNEDDWYGTQSMPTSLEKAEWALNDINDYRTESGLEPLDEKILKQNYECAGGSNTILFSIPIAILWLLMIYVLYQIRDLSVYKDNTYTLFKHIEKGLKLSEKNENNNKFVLYSRNTFPVYWKDLTENRRRGNTGNFVQTYGREPTETEILTGDIQL
jgi:hypothetical protein